MREILLGYWIEKIINYFFLLSSDPLFQGLFKVLIYLQMIKALSTYFPVDNYKLQAFAIFIWKSVNCCRSFLSLWFSKLWMWCGLMSLSSLVFVWTEDARFYCCHLCHPPAIFACSAFSRYFLHLRACAFLLDIKELTYAWGAGLILKDGDKSPCVNRLFVF